MFLQFKNTINIDRIDVVHILIYVKQCGGFIRLSYLCVAYNVLMRLKIAITFLLLYTVTFISANNFLQVTMYGESKVDSLCNIVGSSNVSYSKKNDMMNSFSSVSLYPEYFDKLYPLFNTLLEEARQNSHKDGMLFCFNSIANLYLSLGDKSNTQKYLDSAEVYINKVNNLQYLASYYGIRGRYIQRYFPDRTPEAINDYHNSLYYYDKSGKRGYEDEKAIILRDLTMDGFQRNDSAYVCKNIHKILDLRKYHNSPIVGFCIMEVNIALNSIYHQKTLEQKYLDSIVIYSRKCLDLYESGLLSNAFTYIAIDFYTIMAEAMSQKSGVDGNVVDSLFLVAESKYELMDSVGIARVHQIKASILFDRGMVDSAEVMALDAQKYLAAGYKYNYYSLAKSNAALLRDIYNVKGDYKKAIEYDDILAKKDEEIRANEIKELELRFDVFVKDTELKQLNSNVVYYDTIQKVSVLICVLLCLATLFLVLLIRSKRKNLNRDIALINVENEDAKLKLKLTEEQTVKTQLERYEVLSDFYLKEMELIGKNKDLEQLYLDKEALDKQVELFRQKVESLDVLADKTEQTGNDVQNVIADDLKRLISRQMPDGSVYINNIDLLSKSYVDALNEKSDGNLSVSYLKYCICFAIGMSISDVADCFEIEQSSVHMVRYRLKKKFGLGNDDDLGAFLQSDFR